MTSVQKNQCDCYCHKPNAHSCDYGNGICGGCGEPSKVQGEKKCDCVFPIMEHKIGCAYATDLIEKLTDSATPSTEGENWEARLLEDFGDKHANGG